MGVVRLIVDKSATDIAFFTQSPTIDQVKETFRVWAFGNKIQKKIES